MVEKQEGGFGEHGIDKVCDLHGEEALHSVSYAMHF